jgi:peptidoglycan/xylan/chitin deacetylase (PgdA/CDA1 family)
VKTFRNLLLILITFSSLLACSQNQSPRVLILVYHAIVDDSVDPTAYQRRVSDVRDDFEQIRKSDYQVISYQELVDKITANEEFTENTAVIAFDDGGETDYTIAYPLLVEYDYKATFFICSNFPYDWSNISEMYAYQNSLGVRLFDFQSHSHTHKKLAYISDEDLYLELAESKRIIENHLNNNVTILALPYGNGYNDTKIKTIAESLGYQAIRTTVPGKINSYTNLMTMPGNCIFNNTNIKTKIQ